MALNQVDSWIAAVGYLVWTKEKASFHIINILFLSPLLFPIATHPHDPNIQRIRLAFDVFI